MLYINAIRARKIFSALLSLCSLPLGLFAMGMMFKAGMERMNAYYAASAKMNATIIEYVNGMEVVKVFGRDGESYQRYESDIKSYRDFTLAWYKVCWPWMALYSAILPCTALVMLPAGTLFVINGISTLADLVHVFCLSLSIGIPLLKALSFAGKFPQLSCKIDEIEKAMDNKPLKSDGNSFIGNSHIVKFEDVRFSYKEKEVLYGVSLELGEGTLTALVRESGSGKSTLAKLLVHYFDIIIKNNIDYCFLMIYRIIKPLIGGVTLFEGYHAVHIAIIFVYELATAILHLCN